MNKPPLSLVALLALAPLLAGGCTLYSNPSACKTQMREAAGQAAPSETLSISNVDVGIGGSRVVLEGTLKTTAATTASGATKPTVEPAAAECTFDGDKLAAFRWLAPSKLANPPAPIDAKS
jgi:hypothetical protein